MPIDLFNSNFLDVGGIAESHEGKLEFTVDPDGTPVTYYLAAHKISVGYKDEIKTIKLPGGTVILVSSGAIGTLNAQTLLGKGVLDFQKHFGDICNMLDSNPLRVRMDSGLVCDGVDLDVQNSITLDLYNNYINQLNFSTGAQKPMIASSLTMLTLNIQVYSIDGQTV